MTQSHETDTQNTEKFLKAVDDIVPINGWTEASLDSIADAAELDNQTLWELCPDGVESAVSLFCKSADDAMRTAHDRLPWNNMGIGYRVQKLIESRLTYLVERKATEIKTFHWLCVPYRSAIAYHIGFRTVDLIWQLAEDKLDAPSNKDFSYYSKRVTTLAILSATTLFWMQDDSFHHEETSAFLQRRLKNHVGFTKWTNRIKKHFYSSHVSS